MANVVPPPPYQDIKKVPIALQLWYNQLKAYVSSSSGTITWTTVSKAGANITDIPNRDHNNLNSIFGGAAADYYHWKQLDYTSFTTLLSTSTTPYTVLTTDGYILVDATAGAKAVNLPAATNRKRYTVKKIDGSANAVTINIAGSDTIEGLTTYSLANQYSSVTFYSDGSSKWYIECFKV